MSSIRNAAAAALLLASGLAAQPPYKFSTTVYGTPLDSFGTTVAANSGFRGDIYDLHPGTQRLPDFSKLKPVGAIYTPYLCVPPRSFEETKKAVWEHWNFKDTAYLHIAKPGGLAPGKHEVKYMESSVQGYGYGPHDEEYVTNPPTPGDAMGGGKTHVIQAFELELQEGN